MKFSLPCVIIILVSSLLAAFPAVAQYVKLRDFGVPTQGTTPYGSLVTDGTFLYGTASTGGTNNAGTIYKVRPNGTNFSVIHHFDITNGSTPNAGLFYDGTTLYGTTYAGGGFGQGTIYRINTDGTGFSKMLDFDYFTSGGFPLTQFISDGTVLYGTTMSGGAGGNGTVFKINKDGTGHTKIFEFGNSGSNGAQPQGNIVYDGTYIYGTTRAGGANFDGVAYRVKADGTGFEILHTFNGLTEGYGPVGGFFYDGTFLWGTTIQTGSGFGSLFRIMPNGSSYQVIQNFFGASNGMWPRGTLVSDGTFLYGTTSSGGPGGKGTLYRVMLNGTGFTTLSGLSGDTSGSTQEGTLLMTGTTLYGTRSAGGFGRVGSVYKIDTDGTNESILQSFQVEGYDPVGELISDGTFLYGVTNHGGLHDDGTVYKVKPDGTGFQKLFDFEDVSTGGMPIGALFLDGATLFGMTTQGGTSNAGTLYRIDADGTDFTKLLDFDITNNGGFPTGGLTSDGTFLYGMTAGGGSNSAGTIFKILPNGTGYTKLYDFDYSSGGTPEGTLLLDGTIMYGLASSGGDFGQGVIFSILTDGDDYNPMHEFDYTPDGAQPRGSLVADANFLYGVTYAGGSNDAGTIFKIKKDGNSFQVLKHLENGPGTGAHPTGSLARDNNYLYGLTSSRGVDEKGTLFRIKFDGTGFDKMLDFNDGSNGSARPLTDGITLWATTYSGGKFNHGIMFRRSLADYVSITKFSPTQGAVGTYVKILGNDFDPVAANNTVQFDGITATVVSASIGEIVAIVPDGASDGPITVTAGGTDTSITDFMVIPEAVMFDGTVKTCNAVFIFDGAPDDLTETFVPGVAGGKIKVTFTFMDIDDELWIYDGPDDSSPKVAELGSGDNSFEYVSTAPGGELTFRYIWQDASSTWEADIECVGAGVIIITNQPDDMEICGNTAVSFTTAATGANNIKYQWQFFDGTDWVDLANDTHYSNVKTASLAVNTTGNFGAGIYRCRVNADGATEVITNEANLVVDPAPDPPTGSGTIDPTCGPFVFDLSVTGGTDGQYRWYTVETGGTPISGAVNSTFTTPSLTATTTYYVANFNGTCESTRMSVSATIKPCTAPVIATANGAAPINGVATIDIASLITDAENDIDVSTLKIIVQPASGAVAVFAGTTLTIDYAGTDFTGTDVLTIEVCDIEGLCATRQVEITIATEIIVYNAVSPNGDGKNDSWVLEYIDLLPSTRSNRVKIYNRWGDEVFEVSDYNNNDRVFNGVNKNGNKLPSGTYFYKISFTGQNGPPDLTGYLQLKY